VIEHHNHKVKEHQASYDHWAGGTMGLSQLNVRPDDGMFSASGGTIGHRAHDKSHDQDHFMGGAAASMEMAADSDAGVLSQSGQVMSHKGHVAGHEDVGADHFAGHGMAMAGSGIDGTEGAVIVSAQGTVLSRVGHQSAHGGAEHSFDHFAGGSMAMGGNAGDVALMSGMGDVGHGGRGHVQGQCMSADHFSGMALDKSVDGSIVDVHGVKLQAIGHKALHGKAEHAYDHFQGGTGMLVSQTVLSKKEQELVHQSTHFANVFQ